MPRIEQVHEVIAELRRRGYAEPEVDAEISDPDTGAVLAVAEAFWLKGLQEELGDPVILELDAEDADLPRLEELKMRVFT